jgi:nucleoside-diphosphate-sugar epimerase
MTTGATSTALRLSIVEAGQFVWLDHGQMRTSTTHIANVAHAIELALIHGRGGQAYFVTDDSTTTYREFLTALLQTQGLAPPERSLPGRERVSHRARDRDITAGAFPILILR